jgi:hypothetical protein
MTIATSNSDAPIRTGHDPAPATVGPIVTTTLHSCHQFSSRSLVASDAQVLLAGVGDCGKPLAGSSVSWLRDLQRTHGLRTLGLITPSTWQALMKWCDVRAS